MRKILIALLPLVLAACSSTPKSLVTSDSTQKGQVLGYFWGDDERVYVPFSNDGKGKDAVIATQGYVDGKLVTPFTGTLKGQLNVTNTSTSPKASFAKYVDGSGHKDAATSLNSESQYLRIGGREYGLNSYRGLGFGYASDLSTTIQPVFIGYQETNIDNSTYGDAVFATRANNQNIAPTVRFRVTSQGDIQAASGYVPKTGLSVATKDYVDKAVSASYEQGYSAGVAYGIASCHGTSN